MEGRKKILIAPMNWGLGHAARCVPLISALLDRNAEVIIAADGRALQLLRNEFPQLRWIKLPGYDIRYWWNKAMVIQIFLQLPKFIVSFYRERKWLKHLLAKEKFDWIISDNRYGLYNEQARTVFITHQINIQLPHGLKWLESFLYRIGKKRIEQFDECWIPDLDGEQNLSGKLSHSNDLPRNAKFIGLLSKFSFEEKKKERDLLIVISGPENQRTKFEALLTEQAIKSSLKILMVCGTPESKHQQQVTPNFSKVDFLQAEELNHAFLSSKIIIARSGYSTIMDLVATRSQAILIPTPGQTEQEYLADYLAEKKNFYSETQNRFELTHALKMSASNADSIFQHGRPIFKTVYNQHSGFEFLDSLFESATHQD